MNQIHLKRLLQFIDFIDADAIDFKGRRSYSLTIRFTPKSREYSCIAAPSMEHVISGDLKNKNSVETRVKYEKTAGGPMLSRTIPRLMSHSLRVLGVQNFYDNAAV
ncbi:hypothetical protein MKW98_006600 [Papaver atlanticum]|uniref:Uncharacterized protein n=1 Tax=Papaver atlanticum TaxID=357466 RepID=A0AAD4T9U7_9MAGN|nr:hypothetical protein MKW98_006600 [Papaver atlanticum]